VKFLSFAPKRLPATRFSLLFDGCSMSL
jgi:hypothetical protein